MSTWILDAIDPLFFGDGRSVGSGANDGRILPPPQVVAGLARTRQGQDERGLWVGDPDEARTIPVRGPFAALLNAQGAVSEWLFPRPADALALDGGLRRLFPLDLAVWKAKTNLPDDGLVPTGLVEPDPSKPVAMNAFWRWSDLRAWLEAPTGVPATKIEGVSAPPVEARTHVAIDAETGRVRDDGALFGTTGRRMLVKDGAIAIGLCTDATIREGAAPAGGERRMVRWRRADAPLPSAPEAVLSSAEAGAVRVVLATPAIFRQGWRPERLFGAPAGSTLVSACVGRPEVVSGWDLAKQQARPTRRCAAAGSVYFLKLGGTPAERRAWVEASWLAPCSDDEHDCFDGYGSVLFGAWDGRILQPSSSSERPR